MYNLAIEQIFVKIKTSEKGLSLSDVENRLKKYGENKLPKSREKATKLGIFFEQWKSPLIIILLVAGIISGFMGEFVDMSVISITVLVNVLIGFFQEYKANEALSKLNKMIEYKAIVIRDGRQMQIDSQNIVPGDIMVLDAGEKVQADGRIFYEVDLQVDESVLTGESEPIKKNIKVLKNNLAIGDRVNMVFKGTTIVNGRAKVVVISTGKDTEIGKIATMVKETKEDKTPLQKQLSSLGRKIGFLVLLISLAIFALGVFSKSEHHTLLEMFETAVAVAVAAIPEGLVISMTVILAIGMQHILKKKALVRKLLAAETLGSVTVICTDKTGTLTEGRMRITRLVTSNDDLNFEELKLVNLKEEERHQNAILGLRIGIMCNDGILTNPEDEENKWVFVGDTTDTAFIYAGMKVGLEKHLLDQVLLRVDEIPFDSKNKFMVTKHNIDHESLIYVKGAAEMLYSKCKFYEDLGKAKKMTKAKLEWFKNEEEQMTKQGLRVLALAYKKEDEQSKELKKTDLDNLVLVGLVALSDPLRIDARETINKTKQAGIRTVMITGDHVRTAQSIARELDIPSDDHQIFDGQKLEKLTDEELKLAVRDVYVFARVDPKHKIRIVKAFQANGEVVAMTGDGVNDAPALKGADIGVALGSGTTVAKEIADIVLLNDHFNTIVSAVEEGRSIYQNIKKVVLYLLSGSLAEVVLIAGSLVAGLPLAILPAQILWVNLIEDSFPNMALAFDGGEKENMSEKPRKRNESIIDKEMKVMILIISVISNFVLLGMFLYFWKHTGDIALTRTIIFVGLGIDSLFYIYSVRSMRHMIWQTNLFSNNYLTGAVLFGWLMLIGAVYFPPLQFLLKTVNLTWQHWGVLLVFGLLNVFLIEVIKGLFLRNNKVN